jgi:hypothetical protein
VITAELNEISAARLWRLATSRRLAIGLKKAVQRLIDWPHFRISNPDFEQPDSVSTVGSAHLRGRL